MIPDSIFRYVAKRAIIFIHFVPHYYCRIINTFEVIQKLASRRVTGWNGREFFPLRHSSKVRFHPLLEKVL